MIQKSLLVFVLIISTCTVKSQSNGDLLNLMNGQTFNGTITDTSNGKVMIQIMQRSKIKTVEFEHYRVFSYQKKNEAECILYKKDTTIGNFLEPAKMKNYFLGERDSREKYNPLGTKIISFLFSYTLTVFDTYNKDSTVTKFPQGFFRGEPGIISIVAPVVVTTLAGIPAVQIRIDKVSNRNLLNSQEYIDGFEKIGRSKKVFGALKFSLLGSALGLATYFIAR